MKNGGIMMRKIVCVLLVVFICVVCSIVSEEYGVSKAYADTKVCDNQREFLENMANGITTRLANVDDAGHANDTDEQRAEYLKSLVMCELELIANYDDVVFEDSKFDDLAHHYIQACKMQYSGAENIKNTMLYNALWSGGSMVRSGIIVTMYERYDLPIDSSTVSNYLGSSGYTNNNVSSPAPQMTQNIVPYSLGEVITVLCDRGTAKVSLDKVEVVGDKIEWTVTNHGEIGFTIDSSFWNISVYDSDGYYLSRGTTTGHQDPLKPGSTVIVTADLNYSSFSKILHLYL